MMVCSFGAPFTFYSMMDFDKRSVILDLEINIGYIQEVVFFPYISTCLRDAVAVEILYYKWYANYLPS